MTIVKIRTFAALPIAEQALALLALLLIGAGTAMIGLLRFRSFAGLFGRQQGAVGYIPLVDARETRRAILVRRAVGRAASVAPFRSDCLPQAIAAALLARLLRFPLTVHFGVDIGTGTMTAHAWATAGRVMVSGGYSFDDYAIVSCFAIQPHRS